MSLQQQQKEERLILHMILAFYFFFFSLSLSSVLFYERVFTLQNILYSVDNYGLLISGPVKQILKNWQTSEERKVGDQEVVV